MQNLDEILLCKRCKEGAFVVTLFFTPQKNQKLIKEKKKIQKNTREYT
jgi:hypothetical protein